MKAPNQRKPSARSVRLNPRQQTFVDAYLIDPNAAQAAKLAGYSHRTAQTQGSRLLSNAMVGDAIQAARDQRAARLELSQDWVIDQLRENVERAMQKCPVLDRAGTATGEYTYQGSVANKALELLGKRLGMFSGKLDFDPPDLSTMSDAELERWRRELKII